MIQLGGYSLHQTPGKWIWMKLNEKLKLEEDVGGILGGKESLLKQPTRLSQGPFSATVAH